MSYMELAQASFLSELDTFKIQEAKGGREEEKRETSTPEIMRGGMIIDGNREG